MIFFAKIVCKFNIPTDLRFVFGSVYLPKEGVPFSCKRQATEELHFRFKLIPVFRSIFF